MSTFCHNVNGTIAMPENSLPVLKLNLFSSVSMYTGSLYTGCTQGGV